jgi:linoleoyl-CoA desaturase
MTLSTYLWFRAASGVVMGLAGFNIGHDGAHGSYSKNEVVNEIMSWVFDASGASSFMWKTKHNVIHHHVTNTPEDDDVDTNSALRLGFWQKWRFVYIFQPFYAFILYGVLHFFWFAIKDIYKYFTGRIGGHKIKQMTKNQKIFFWAGKLVYLFKSLILPMIVFGSVKGGLGFIVLEFVCGFIIAIVFQMAHVQNKATFYVGNPNINMEWAVFQLKTTADFGTWNPVWFHLFGGLNFQVEHHLFPDISHVHYRRVRKILKQHCREFNVEYNEYKTFIGVFIDHISYLCKMAWVKNHSQPVVA